MSRVGGYLLSRGGAVAAGASAGIAAPSSSHCRAQTQSKNGLLNSGKADNDGAVSLDGGHITSRFNDDLIDKEWLVTDVHNDQVMFGPEEISDVINTVMGMPHPREAPRVVGSEVAIHELRDDLSDSDESSGTEANDYMYAAGMQVARAHNERDNMVLALNNMLNRPDVQSVVLRALLEDPTVQNLVHDRHRVVGESFLPQAAQAGMDTSYEKVVSDVTILDAEESSIKKIAERVAANIVNLGQHIRDSAAHLLVNLGYQIHSLLGRPFKQAPGAAKSEDGVKPEAAMIPKLLMTVGCAVITLLLFKRLHIV